MNEAKDYSFTLLAKMISSMIISYIVKTKGYKFIFHPQMWIAVVDNIAVITIL